MADPTCRIEWHRDGFQVIRLFSTITVGEEANRGLCMEVANLADASQSVDEFSLQLRHFASNRGAQVEVLRGGHSDPLELALTVVLRPSVPG